MPLLTTTPISSTDADHAEEVEVEPGQGVHPDDADEASGMVSTIDSGRMKLSKRNPISR